MLAASRADERERCLVFVNHSFFSSRPDAEPLRGRSGGVSVSFFVAFYSSSLRGGVRGLEPCASLDDLTILVRNIFSFLQR